jgi:hypothetical protein
MWLALRGFVEPEDITNFVAAWSEHHQAHNLGDWLGMSPAQFTRWQHAPDSLDEIIEGERTADHVMIKKLVSGLTEYADPAFYHGILVMGDPPCGGFIDDVDEDHGDQDYPGYRQGSLARRTIAHALEVPYGMNSEPIDLSER